jgi:hypothetical protein
MKRTDITVYTMFVKRRIVMRVKQMGWRLLVVLTLAGLLAGCSSPTATLAPTAAPTTAPSVVPTAAATIDLQPTFNAIKTQSAATIIANLTQNAPSATPVAPATATATKPPLPTATSAPSSTSLPRATATVTAALTAWTLVPTQAAYSCIVTNFSPKASVSYPPSSSFDVQWVIKNTGKLRWLATETQFHYVDGAKMQKYGDTVNLKTDVAPNESYTVGIDMLAPTTAGTYNITWQLTYGKVYICTMSMSVVIK